ncbi:hypothetical protein PspLS_06091, partial [Pyricularia sp. CBS 133598]
VTTRPHTSSVTDPNKKGSVQTQGNRHRCTFVVITSGRLRVRAIDGVLETDPNHQAIRSLVVAGVRSDLEQLPKLLTRIEAVQLTKESQGVVVAFKVDTLVARGILRVRNVEQVAPPLPQTGPIRADTRSRKDANAQIGTGLVQLAGGDLKHES